ncbi:YciK family oxidoreductase [Alkalimarinus alittae]|uniref:YciK family oxidoreductase n=1 Tax=Alkalimarinus alittae TaxID=2961619 RepID=A0ABY6MYJ5_9ALTE|nr:YciK family oxidoreductase [Alkalimarinus alittae]UZE94917.1 YciK family oxidoreductase [Alkalimarinus alittae]
MQDYQAPKDLLEGKVILVTGAGSGIGQAAAKAYAAHGATVILLGRTIKKLEDVYDEIEAAGHPQAAIYPMNLEGAVAKDYDDMAATIQKEFGRLDGILHNAALLGSITPIEQYDPNEWTKLMQVNLNAPFMMTQALISLLRESEDASIIFTSSSVGRKGRAYWGAYSVSKFGVEGLMQVLADELDDEHNNVRVNSINPGATRTNMRAHAFPAENPTHNPLPEDIMGIYLYLMGNESTGKTGQAFDAQKK